MSTCAAARLVDVPPSLMRSDLERRDPSGVRFQDLTGATFGKLTVIGLAGFLKQYTAWLCTCECGNLCLVRANSLKHRELGCGCGNKTHGQTGTGEYFTYAGMKRRCLNPSDSGFPLYGGRGIKVCERWLDSFENFYADMGPRPSESHSLDRIDNEGDYCKENCRWATRKQQAQNKRGVRWIEHDGERLVMSDWAARVGVTRERMRQRFNRCIALNASLSEAITTPPNEMMPCVRAAGERRKEAKTRFAQCGRKSAIRHGVEIVPDVSIDAMFDGTVRHYLCGDLTPLFGANFDYELRKECQRRNLKPYLRKLGEHVLFRAVPRK